MFQKPRRRQTALVLGATFAVGLSACGGVTQFNDTTPINVAGPVQAMPPATLVKRVEIKNDHIEITDSILFEVDTANIRPESHGLLDEIVGVLADNPQLTKVDIIGHTSDDGEDSYNQTLSDKRAKAVLAYFTTHGIDASRLGAKGMGEAQPIADNTTSAGRKKNRRVEFLILEQGGTK